MSSLAIEINNLSKIYKNGKKALDNMSLHIPKGVFFALLGPNGAGKSTLINIIGGITKKSSGSVKINNLDTTIYTRATKQCIGIVPQELYMDPFATPKEALIIQAGLFGIKISEKEVMKLLEALNLADKANSSARSLSGGMRRRLLVAKAMVHRPNILILDEPTAGVDIQLRINLWEYVKELNKKFNTTILLTTHHLEEAEDLCSLTAIINNGQLIANDNTKLLIKNLDQKNITVTLHNKIETIPSQLLKYNITLGDDLKTLSVNFKPSVINSIDILRNINQTGIEIADFSTQDPDLEQLFIKLTKQS